MIEAALAQGPVSVLTNGVLIRAETAERLRALADASAYSLDIRVSLDGWDAATNDADPRRGDVRAHRGRDRPSRRGRAARRSSPSPRPARARRPPPAATRFLAVPPRRAGCASPRLKVLPLLRIGAEAARTRGYAAVGDAARPDARRGARRPRCSARRRAWSPPAGPGSARSSSTPPARAWARRCARRCGRSRSATPPASPATSGGSPAGTEAGPGPAPATARMRSISAPAPAWPSSAACTPTISRWRRRCGSPARGRSTRSSPWATSAASGRIPTARSSLLRRADVHAMRGNYEESLAGGGEDCGCGYTDPRDNHYAQISYDYTRARTSREHTRWMATLPGHIRLTVAGRRVLLLPRLAAAGERVPVGEHHPASLRGAPAAGARRRRRGLHAHRPALEPSRRRRARDRERGRAGPPRQRRRRPTCGWPC